MHLERKRKWHEETKSTQKEMKEQTAAFILETGKPATKTAKETGIDVNTVCRWVRDYRKEHNMPSYAEKKGIHKRPVPDAELRARNRFTRGNTI